MQPTPASTQYSLWEVEAAVKKERIRVLQLIAELRKHWMRPGGQAYSVQVRADGAIAALDELRAKVEEGK